MARRRSIWCAPTRMWWCSTCCCTQSRRAGGGPRPPDVLPGRGILVLSGSAAEGLQDMLLEMGVRGYLPKTASASEFMAAVRAVAGGMTVRLPGMRRLAEPLTDREMEVLLLVVSGLNNDAIAAEMGIAAAHRRYPPDAHLRQDLSSRNRGDLAHYALRQGIIPPAVPLPG